MLYKVIFALFIYSPLLLVAQDLSFESEKWMIDAQGSVIESHHGYQSLYLKGGSVMWLEADLKNFELEFDIFLQERRSFSGVMFRIEDADNYEEIYFRGHLSGKPDAMQYTPVFNGTSAWQLYHSQARPVLDGMISWELDNTHAYNNLYRYNFDDWTHAKLIVKGRHAHLFLDETLVLNIRDLKRGLTSGGFGFKSGLGGVHFANVSYKETTSNKAEPSQEISIDNMNIVQQWSVSSSFHDSLVAGIGLSDGHMNSLKWDDSGVEHNGLLNISKLRKRSRKANTVLVNTTIKVDKNEIRRFNFGYSDKVSVFLNGQKIYAGDNGYRSRDYRYLGTIGFFDELYLPLHPGKNTLTLAVSEVFGGWGVMGILEPN